MFSVAALQEMWANAWPVNLFAIGLFGLFWRRDPGTLVYTRPI